MARESLCFPVPGPVGDEEALALLVQGVTAWHLVNSCGRVREGESVVVHAAAGGVGSLAVQLARRAGARVIATASSESKRALALELGTSAAVSGEPEGLAGRLIEANGGERVDVVLEMVGGEVFRQSLGALGPFGRLVIYGQTSHEPSQVEAAMLQARSRSIVGFWLMDCLARDGMLSGAARGAVRACRIGRAERDRWRDLPPGGGGACAPVPGVARHDRQADPRSDDVAVDPAGKTAVVTGAASGIGRALAEGLARAGARVVVSDIDAAGAASVAEGIEREGRLRGGGERFAIAVPCDVASAAEVDALFDASEAAFGPVDLFCANAGVAGGYDLDAPDDGWDLALAVNVRAHVYAARQRQLTLTPRSP